jgi:hypothetical protein
VQKGEAYFTQGESRRLSIFLRDGHSIFHTYSTHARGTDLLAGTYNYLDLRPVGRQEDWHGHSAAATAHSSLGSVTTTSTAPPLPAPNPVAVIMGSKTHRG